MIKTISLTANQETAVKIEGGSYCLIENRGTSVVYASKFPNVVASEDNVIAIDSASAKILENATKLSDSGIMQGTIYLVTDSDGAVEVRTATTTDSFKLKQRGGGGSSGGEITDTYTKPVIDAKLSTKADKEVVNQALDNKVNKDGNKVLSDNNFSNDEKQKLAGLENYDDKQIKNDIALNTSSIGLRKKNLLKYTETSKAESEITFTVNDDKNITVSGKNTSSSTVWFRFAEGTLNLPIGGTYTVSGCPTNNRNEDNTLKCVLRVEALGATVATDNGEGKTFTTVSTKNPIYMVIAVYAGADFTDNPVTFYPMIRYSDVTDDTYEPYTPSVQEQINDILARLTALEG